MGHSHNYFYTRKTTRKSGKQSILLERNSILTFHTMSIQTNLKSQFFISASKMSSMADNWKIDNTILVSLSLDSRLKDGPFQIPHVER